MKERQNSLIKNQKGSVIVEFVLLFSVLMIMFAFLTDLVILRSTMGKLDRASYSVLNIIKERETFIDGATRSNPEGDEIKPEELEDMQEIATRLVYGEKSDKKVSVILEYLIFDDPELDGDGNRLPVKVKKTEAVPALGNDPKCTVAKPIKDLTKLAPISEGINGLKPRVVPIYQVTLCADAGTSFFKALLISDANRSLGMLRSSSVGVRR